MAYTSHSGHPHSDQWFLSIQATESEIRHLELTQRNLLACQLSQLSGSKSLAELGWGGGE